MFSIMFSCCRFLTFCYLAAFNCWLLLCPWALSHDWQMGSVPLVTSWFDPRNLATLLLFGSCLALAYKGLNDFEVSATTSWKSWGLKLVEHLNFTDKNFGDGLRQKWKGFLWKFSWNANDESIQILWHQSVESKQIFNWKLQTQHGNSQKGAKRIPL